GAVEVGRSLPGQTRAGHRFEAMDGAGVDVDFGGNPLVDQATSVREVFVKKQVERAGGDVGGRKVGKIFGQHRREPALTMVVRSIVAAQRFPTELVLLARPDE